MKLTLEGTDAIQFISRYDQGLIVVNDQTYTGSVVITPDETWEWPPQTLEELQTVHFERLAAIKPEVMLLGTGARLRFPGREGAALVRQAGIGLEIMDTGAACRTYNILAGEGRRVLAALLVI